MLDLKGKTALVTGSGRGIGRAAAMQLGKCGAEVIFHATAMNDTLQSALQEAASSGIRCRAVTGDLGREEDLSAILAGAGSPDILVLNASVQKYMTLPEFSREEFRRTFLVNVLSCVEMVKAFLPAMQARSWGRVIAVGSVNQWRPAERLFTYAASKAALANFMSVCARNYASGGVTFNTIVPGVIATDRNRAVLSDPEKVQKLLQGIPAKSLGTAVDCAGIIALLASDEGRYINGAEIPVDGGMGL